MLFSFLHLILLSSHVYCFFFRACCCSLLHTCCYSFLCTSFFFFVFVVIPLFTLLILFSSHVLFFFLALVVTPLFTLVFHFVFTATPLFTFVVVPFTRYKFVCYYSFSRLLLLLSVSLFLVLFFVEIACTNPPPFLLVGQESLGVNNWMTFFSNKHYFFFIFLFFLIFLFILCNYFCLWSMVQGLLLLFLETNIIFWIKFSIVLYLYNFVFMLINVFHHT